MDKTLRILMLEDNPADAELIQFEIEEAKIAFTAKVVMTEKDFIHALQEFSPHIILSDYDLPGYTGALALFEARKRCPDVPFILVTGAISEDRAIDSLTGGAKDYVMKSRLHRLAPAVRRALAEAEEQKARKTAEEELRAASHYSRSLIEASLDPLVTISPDGKVMDVNKATEEVTGVSRDQIIGRDFSDYFTEPEKARAGYKEAFLHGSVKDYPLALRHISGRVTEVLYNATTYMNEEGEVHGVFAAARDITRIRAIESELRETHRNLEKQIEARMHELQESKEHLRLALTSSMMGIFEWDAAKKKLHWDNNMHLLMGTRPENFSGTTEEMLAVIHPEDRNDFVDAVKKAIEQGSTYENEYRVVWPDGGIHHVITRGKVYQDKMNHPVRIIGIGWDVTEKQQAEKALRESREQFRYALETSHTGAWNLNLKDHSASRSLEHDRIFGYTELLPQWTYEIFLDHILPEDRDAVDAKFRYAVQTGGDWDFDCRIRRTDGEVRWIWAAGRHRKGSDGDPPYLFGIVQDITERKLAEEELEKKAVQLEATNKELESFSYSVSHDLQAPLRAIEGFSRMILKKHGDRFDEETRNRFEVIRTNTEKMRQLIEEPAGLFPPGQKASFHGRNGHGGNCPGGMGRTANRQRRTADDPAGRYTAAGHGGQGAHRPGRPQHPFQRGKIHQTGG